MFFDIFALFEADGNGFDWRSVSTNNPEVQEAAKHAMKSLQQKSNSLFPYKLIDIILARAKVELLCLLYSLSVSFVITKPRQAPN